MILLENKLVSFTETTIINSVDDALERFNALKSSGIIESESFDEDNWITTDEFRQITLSFKLNKSIFKKDYQPIFNIDAASMIIAIKKFVLSLFGSLVLPTIKSVLLDILFILSTPIDQIYDLDYFSKSYRKIVHPNYIQNFFASFPALEEDERAICIKETLDAYIDASSLQSNSLSGARELSDLLTYLRFDNILNDYWLSDISDDDRLYYYPLFIWWKITAIIPTRPQELILLPRDCVYEANGEYYLRMRKNAIKGFSFSKKIEYKISSDFNLVVFKINQELYNYIQNYIKLTTNYTFSNVNTLFVTEPYTLKHKSMLSHKSMLFSYNDLNNVLTSFYNDIIVAKCGYSIVNHPASAEKHDIGMISLGDTRHLAMINLTQNNVPLAAAAILAGHSNIDITTHYASNVETILKSASMRKAFELESSNKQYSITPINQKSVSKISSAVPLQTGGYCYSQKFQHQDFNDCLIASGPNNEIGYCAHCCYYSRGSFIDRDKESLLLQNINDSAQEVKYALGIAKKCKNDPKAIGETLYRLIASEKAYEEYKDQEIIEKEENYGQAEANR